MSHLDLIKINKIFVASVADFTIQFSIYTKPFIYITVQHMLTAWDIYGKKTNKPIYELLGGSLRDQVNYFYY